MTEESKEDTVEEGTSEVGKGFEKNQQEVLSKRQLKRMARSEKYYATRMEKRAEEKARHKAKRKAMKEAGEGEKLKKPKLHSMADSKCKIRVAVDMQWDELMAERDRKSTIAQLAFSYAQNRRAENPLQYHIVAFNGHTRKVSREYSHVIFKIFDANSTNANWDVEIHETSLENSFQMDEIIYLTAESDNVLMSLDESKVYVIGGLVDHNDAIVKCTNSGKKGVCHAWAQERGLATARLPIDEFVKLNTRKVLTINHVFEILLRWTENGGDWEKAFFTVIPQRKGLQKKEEGNQTDEEKESIKEEGKREGSMEEEEEQKPES